MQRHAKQNQRKNSTIKEVLKDKPPEIINLVWVALELLKKKRQKLPHFSFLGSVATFIKSMETLRKIASIVDDNSVWEADDQRLRSQKRNLLLKRVFQDSQWLFRLPLATSLPQGGLGYL